MKSINNVMIKPELTEKAKKIYQAACGLEDMAGKFGGSLLQIQEAFYLGKLFFEKRLNL